VPSADQMRSIVANQRMGNQRLSRQRFGAAADAVRWMGAMQAQDYGQALWAVGCRLRVPTVAAVTEAIEAAAILRTWPMRGTIHFVPALDARWMLELTAPRTFAAEARRLAQLGLDDSTLVRCHALLRKALAGRRRMTRPRLMALLEDSGVSTAGQRGYHVLTHAAQRGVICLGPMEGKQQTFVLLDDWVPDATVMTRERALAELARRYFTSHGPATAYDFAWWTGLTVTEVRQAISAAAVELSRRDYEGVEYWTGQAPVRRSSGGALLLAGFDEYLLGYKDRSAVLPARHADRIAPGGNGVFLPTMVLDGQVIGGWKRSVSAKHVTVVLRPFEELRECRDAFCDEAERYARFMGLPLRSVTVEPAAVGAATATTG
jgi:hypothetical protein